MERKIFPHAFGRVRLQGRALDAQDLDAIGARP
jgi:hypothetical protein